MHHPDWVLCAALWLLCHFSSSFKYVICLNTSYFQRILERILSLWIERCSTSQSYLKYKPDLPSVCSFFTTSSKCKNLAYQLIHWNLEASDHSVVSGIGLRCYCELLSEIKFLTLMHPCTMERKPTPFMLTLFVCLFVHARRFMSMCLCYFVFLHSRFCGHLLCCIVASSIYISIWNLRIHVDICFNIACR